MLSLLWAHLRSMCCCCYKVWWNVSCLPQASTLLFCVCVGKIVCQTLGSTPTQLRHWATGWSITSRLHLLRQHAWESAHACVQQEWTAAYHLILWCVCVLLVSQFHNLQELRHSASLANKVFIQRDYSEGTTCKFQTKFPSELESRVGEQPNGQPILIGLMRAELEQNNSQNTIKKYL